MAYVTKQKLVLNEIVTRSTRPLTAREICRAARRKVPGLGIATVYRALRQLAINGLIRVVEIPGVAPHYENAARAHHHFFLCLQCKRLFDLAGCVPGLKRLLPNGFTLKQHEIVLYGECAGCSARAA